MKLERRDFLRAAAVGIPAALYLHGARADAGAASRMGVCIYALGNRVRAKLPGQAPLDDPLAFLEHCHSLGAGGIQVPLKVLKEDAAAKLRAKAEEYGMFVEGIVSLPAKPGEAERLDSELRTASLAGAKVVRTVMIPGARFEKYATPDEFQGAAKRALEALQAAEPVAARHRVRIALENHKDHRVEERLEVFRRLQSEYVGACFDCANSFALLEDPLEVARAYAPWTVSVHLKDVTLAETTDGFSMTDVALGDGFLDLAGMVKILREAKPEVKFSLESITKEPTLVPCLTPAYWATFGEVPARDLARTLRVVKERAGRSLPAAGAAAQAEVLEREENLVRKSLAFARDRLGL
jgi:sugar phosphate isomerase/epimerase